MDISKWRQLLVLPFLVCIVSYTRSTYGFTRTISLFYYCDAVFPISSQELYDIQIYGNIFPVDRRACHVKFYSHDPKNILLYKVTTALGFIVNDEVSIDSSRNGRKYKSEEFITVNSPPRFFNKEMEGDRYINVSAYRVNGHVNSRFSVDIQVYGEDNDDDDDDDDDNRSSLSSTGILGTVLGVGAGVVVMMIGTFYLKRTRCGQTFRSRQRDQSTTTQRPTITGQQTVTPEDIPITTYVPRAGPHPGPAAFLPPYSPEPSSDTIFTVQSYCSSDPPPSYEEVMKSGLREVTL